MARQLLNLNIWMNGLLVGQWEKTRTGELLRYFDEWIHHEQGRPLSLSLPFTPGNQAYRGEIVTSYFDNLLPDSESIRSRLAQRYQTGSAEPFELLTALGRDCVGAIQLLPPDEEPSDLFTISGDTLDEHAIAQLLRNTSTSVPLGQFDHDADLRLSIAGAQEKTALLYHNQQWHRPKGSTPTTHIFKLPLGLVGNMQADLSTSVENEWLCSKIVAAYGLPVANCDIACFEDQKTLIVERFDRRLATRGNWIIRLPQEDMCQATGTSPLKKYQADGGPGMTAILDLLTGSTQAENDRRNFFKAQIVFWLLAATDGHAKNFSITHLAGRRYCSTPLYDILSAHPIIGSGQNQMAPQKVKLAMAVRGSANYYLLDKIQRRHWSAQATQVGLGATVAEEIITELIDSTENVIATVQSQLPHDYPESLANSILDGLKRQSEKLSNMHT
jgi:serine/threonine-protein kinase HipA